MRTFKDGNARPVPPVCPALEDCCRSGCSPCIFDVYEDALARYRAELDAWEKRQVARKRD